jgi:DNA primase
MDIFSFIKKNISIESVVSEYTTLKRAGSYLKARCPFHHEKTASFTISPGKDIFYCFGCHKGGDIITFVSLLENCSQKEAVLLLADRYSIQLPEQETKYTGMQPQQQREKKELYYRLCAVVHRWLVGQYQHTPLIQKYVKSRGIFDKTVDQFSLGYFPGGKKAIQSLLQYARQESILTKELIEEKLLFLSSDGLYYSPFEDRLIIPISDALGRICGFGGRVFQEGDERAKYYNSHENEFFDKGSILFGLFQAKEQIKKKQSVFIVEGYMDCLMMVQRGYQNSVAILGTACSEAHLKQLSRYSDTLYVLYDGDEAGKNALLRLTEKCWRVDVDPFVLSLPPGEDPASYLEKHDSLDEILAQKQDVFSFFISCSTIQLAQKTLHDKIQTIRSILDVIMHIDDSIKQTLLLSQASRALNIAEDTLKAELTRRTKKKDIKEQKNGVIEASGKNTLDHSGSMIEVQDEACITILLGYMLQHPEKIDPFLVELCGFSGRESIQQLCKLLLACIAQNNGVTCSFQALWEYAEDSNKQVISQLIMQKEIEIDHPLFQKQAQQFERQMFKRAVNSFKKQIAKSMQEQDEKKTEQLLKQLVEVQKRFNRELPII